MEPEKLSKPPVNKVMSLKEAVAKFVTDVIAERAYACGSMWRNFGDQQRGFYDVGLIGGAQIDKYGNLNTKEMYLEKCHPGIKPEDVKDNVEWDLKVSPNVGTTEPPTKEQVEIMRILDPYGLYLGTGRQEMADPDKGFEFYMEVLEKSYEAMNALYRQKGI